MFRVRSFPRLPRGTWLAVPLLLAGLGGGIAAACLPPKPLSPVLECVLDQGATAPAATRYVAVWGYNNENTTSVTLGVGYDNKFTPSPAGRGQPTTFATGRKVGVFTTAFNGSNLVWSLAGRTATASSKSQLCAPNVTLAKTGASEVAYDQGVARWTVTATFLGYPGLGSLPQTYSLPVSSLVLTDPGATVVSGPVPADVVEPGGTVTWTLETPLAPEACQTGTASNTATLSLADGRQFKDDKHETRSTLTASAATEVDCTADLSITKTLTSAPTIPGGQPATLTFDIVVTNNGPNAVPYDQILVQDAGATLTPPADPPATLAPGASLTWTATKQVDGTAACDSTIVNTAIVSLTGSPLNDPNGYNDTASASARVVCQTTPQPPAEVLATPATPAGRATGTTRARLRITKSAPARATAGQVVNYTIVVRNTGRVAATRVVVTDVIPARTSLARRVTGASVSGGKVTWRVGTLAAGRSRTLRLQLRLDTQAAGRRCNTAAATASNASRVSDRACTIVTPIAAAVQPAVTG